jgi:hypothetical protein
MVFVIFDQIHQIFKSLVMLIREETRLVNVLNLDILYILVEIQSLGVLTSKELFLCLVQKLNQKLYFL